MKSYSNSGCRLSVVSRQLSVVSPDSSSVWCWQLTSATLRCILMIRSFKHRGLKRLYERGDRSGIRPDLLDTVQEILTVSRCSRRAPSCCCSRLSAASAERRLERLLVRDGASQLAHHFPV